MNGGLPPYNPYKTQTYSSNDSSSKNKPLNEPQGKEIKHELEEEEGHMVSSGRAGYVWTNTSNGSEIEQDEKFVRNLHNKKN